MIGSQALIVLWVALGGAIGSVLRYWCSGFMARSIGETFPWGTMLVNVTGSFLIGFIAVVTGPDGRLLIGTGARQFLMVGILGGYTTFSSLSLQTLALAQDGDWLRAGANVAGTVVLCLAGVWLGFALGVLVNR
jgi:CrcB protein